MPFNLVEDKGYTLVSLTDQPTEADLLSLEKSLLSTENSSNKKLSILHFDKTAQLSNRFVLQLIILHSKIKAAGGNSCIVGANDHTKKLIKENGLEGVLKTRPTLRMALIELGLITPSALDVEFINPFLEATKHVFEIQCQIKNVAQKPYKKNIKDPALLGDVSGIIAISADAFCGTLAVSLPKAIFIQIAKNTMDLIIDKIEEEHLDIVAELANMILGNAKKELANIGYDLKLALPSAILGKNHKVKNFGKGPCIVIPFKTALGIFYTEVMTEGLAKVA